MASKIPSAYLASTEDRDLREPRKCYFLKRLRGPLHNDYLLVKVAPPLIGQLYGLGAKDIDCLILAARHVGFTLFPIREWPVYVHVARPLIDDIEEREDITPAEFEVIAWAELYETEEKAQRAVSVS
jgi:hypothetical protein